MPETTPLLVNNEFDNDSVPESLIEVTEDTATELGLTVSEYELIKKKLGRNPSYTELGIFSVMWSEHCSYKNSILQLKTLPRSGGRLLVEAGEENAGLVDIGDGYAIAFKIESHNHPSAVEPFQGAATGVGGILRDIFTMGARPIAALNSLRFGPLNNERTKYLLSGVVKGISHYGNCFGVPTVGGEVYFDSCYSENPLVNAMAVGIVKTDETASAVADGVGNPVYIVGSSTGRDGIHGASLLASREFDEKTEDMRPTVQVGDPFQEKLLLEATLEMIQAGVVAGMQDMGAAGISCSTAEMSAKSGTGMDINLDHVPLRESDMSAYEIMLSESQERMLVVVHKGMESQAEAIADKWDVPMDLIGQVSDSEKVRIQKNGTLLSNISADYLVLGGDAPVYTREVSKPNYLKKTSIPASELVEKYNTKEDLEQILHQLLSSPTIASKRWIYEQYDSQVRTNTVNIKGNAAILRLKELPGKGIAVSTDCNSRYVYLNPYEGGKSAVAEAARNVACSGAKPVAITNCLNFGNPYDPEVYYQFSEAIRGMGDMCKALDTPVTGGNVSFHNESKNFAIFPTPTIGMLGIIDDLDKTLSSSFKNIGDKIAILGGIGENLSGSEYIKLKTGEIIGEGQYLDIAKEKNLQDLILNLADKQIVHSAHDCSEGGIAVALCEKAISSTKNFGFDVSVKSNDAVSLFNESQSRIIVSYDTNNSKEIERLADSHGVEFEEIGTVTSGSIKMGNTIKSSIKDITTIYEGSIPNLMKSN